jgi:uncharacterized membrane protein
MVGVAALVMLIGFWKTLVLALLFGIGFFIGKVENKQEFIRDTANKIIPAKEAKVIDLKSEITREQEEKQEMVQEMQQEAPAEENVQETEEEKNEDGE